MNLCLSQCMHVCEYLPHQSCMQQGKSSIYLLVHLNWLLAENAGDSRQAFCLDASRRPVPFYSELWVCIVYEVR